MHELSILLSFSKYKIINKTIPLRMTPDHFISFRSFFFIKITLRKILGGRLSLPLAGVRVLTVADTAKKVNFSILLMKNIQHAQTSISPHT
jgi:hypothetical protein